MLQAEGPHKYMYSWSGSLAKSISPCPSVRLSVCMSVRMNTEISETIRSRLLRFGMQIPELLTQRKFVSAECHVHSNAKTAKNCGSYSFDVRIKILTEMYCSCQYLSIDYQRWRNRTLDLDSVALYAAQVCYANMPRPL